MNSNYIRKLKSLFEVTTAACYFRISLWYKISNYTETLINCYKKIRIILENKKTEISIVTLF